MNFTFASANGNTFLIFDCIKSPNVKLNYFYILSWFIAKKVDSCLVIKYHSGNYLKSMLVVTMDVYFPKGGFCGNGARAVGKYLQKTYGMKYKKFSIYSHSMILTIDKTFAELLLPDNIIQIEYNGYDSYLVNTTGENHIIIFTSNKSMFISPPNFKMVTININVCWINNNELYVKTFERGINRYTQSCGTGTVSAWYVGRCLGYLSYSHKYNVYTNGGKLTINPTQNIHKKTVYLSGQTFVK